jgi:8-oxo-dGTP pyrophosphatase MutT (NUDIX family)
MSPKNKVIPEISAGGVVFRKNKNIKILLLKNKNGLWVLPKGKIEPGETLEKAALREVSEETGLTDLRIFHKIGKENYFYRSYNVDKSLIAKTVYYFSMINKGGIPHPQAEEGFVGSDWFSLREALKKIAFKESKNILQKAINQLR